MTIWRPKHRVTVLGASVMRDSLGQPVRTYAPVFQRIHADVRFISGREYVSAERQHSSTLASVRIRQRAVSADMRVEIDGVQYDIQAVLPAGGGFIDLAVVQVQP